MIVLVCNKCMYFNVLHEQNADMNHLCRSLYPYKLHKRM